MDPDPVPRGEVGSGPYLGPQGGLLGWVGAPKDEGSHRPCPPLCSDVLGTGWAEGTLVVSSPLGGQGEPRIPSPGMAAPCAGCWHPCACFGALYGLGWKESQIPPWARMPNGGPVPLNPMENRWVPPGGGLPLGSTKGQRGEPTLPSPAERGLAQTAFGVGHPQLRNGASLNPAVCLSISLTALCSTFLCLVSYQPQPPGGGDQHPQNPTAPMAPTPAAGARGSPNPGIGGCEEQLALPERGLGFGEHPVPRQIHQISSD